MIFCRHMIFSSTKISDIYRIDIFVENIGYISDIYH